MSKQFTVSFFILTLLFLFVQNKIFSQSCDQCNKPRIGIYDPSVLVPKPAETDPSYGTMLPKWWQLFRVGDFMRAYFHNQDGTGSCIFFSDIHVFVSDTSIWGNKIKFGTEWAQTAPSGPVNALDYLVESSVSGANGSYQITASLQSAITRETIASGSINFSDMWDAPSYARQLAAQTFSPLFNKIREWEKNKREEDPEIAIGTDNITITPVKSRIETTEQVSVDFLLKDCDNEPLKNKRLQLIEGEAYGMKLDGPRGGHFAEEYIYTNDEGKAQATFIAGSNPGVGILRAYFIYKYPSGHNGLAGGEAPINISQAPVDYWEISGTISNSLNYVRDTSWSENVLGVVFSGFYQDILTRTSVVSIKGLIKNESDEAGKFMFSGDNYIEAPFAGGSYSEIIMSDKGEYMDNYITSGDKRIDIMSGNALPDAIGLQFYYDNDQDKSISVGVTCARIGDYKGQWYDGPDWIDYSGTYNDSTAGAEAGWWTGMPNGDIIRADSGYFAALNLAEDYDEQTSLCTAHITKTTSMQISIRPYSYLTGVRNTIKDLYPNNYMLYQNFPNPFNPETNVDYYILKDGWVTIKIFNILGREITTLVNEYEKQGMHSTKFIGENLPSGIYFCCMNAGGFVSQKKLMLIK